ncbi:hypothetical protein LTR17_005459 [Elasticomyces elasticus]|nr:hypothetical protein LTR17_005459 [Elasticomyces elasticus]
MATFPAASFLGIPRELRLQIYAELQEQDLEYKVLDRWSERSAYDPYSVPFRNEESRLLIPWLSLLFSCRAVAAEMRSLIRDQAQRDDKHVTYVMDADLGPDGDDMGHVIWQRIPCAPIDAKALVVNCYVDPRKWFAGDGGFPSVVSSMYQTLNLFLHCGPGLNPDKPLRDGHLRLRELVIHMYQRAGTDYYTRPDGSTQYSDAYRVLRGNLFRILCRTGILSGYIEQVRITEGSAEATFVIDPDLVHDGNVSDLWKRCGFEWGLGGPCWSGEA